MLGAPYGAHLVAGIQHLRKDKIMSSPERFVVGVDGSADSRLALEYAAQEAILRGATLRVVSSFESAGRFGARYGVPIAVSDEVISATVYAETKALVNEVVASLPEPPAVEVVVRVGAAGPVLVDESGRADLLVVGHHGRGAIASAVLSSVGLHCVLHAQCPITVVRSRAKRATEPTQAAAGAVPAAVTA
jgi:nucleotide-binding universal stress UspA family protein